jgi:hemerythrin superfamily protein
MELHTLNRRSVLAGAVLTAALLPLQRAVADTAAAGGDWFAMVKSQHAVINSTLNALIDAEADSDAQRLTLLNELVTLLTAHSVAEENVLYPALATHGLPIGSAELYLEQDAQKVLSSVISLEIMTGANATDWVVKAKELRNIILEHAKDHEENDLYPRLREKLDASANATLTDNFQRFFAMVKQS